MADRKRNEDDEDEDLDALDAAASGDAAAEGPADSGDDAPDFEAEEEDSEPSGGGRGRLIIIACVAVAFVVGIAAGGYFFLFQGGDETPVAAGSPITAGSDDGTAMTITRRRMLTAEELAAEKGGATGASSSAAPRPAAPAEGALTPPAPQAQTAAPSAPAPQATASSSAPAAAVPARPSEPSEAPQAKAQPSAKGAKGKNAAPAQGEPSGAGLVTPSVTAAAYRDIPVLPQSRPLTGPIASLIETTDAGQLPRAQGAQGPWRAYARPFDGPVDKPKIAVIVIGMGLSRAPTLAAVNQLPANITLAFDPYAKNPDEWVGLGRSNGHEALLHLPMEATDFPVSDPGPMALLADLDTAQNISRLHQVLASAVGYVGVIQVMGSRFAASEAAMRPVLEETKRRGLLFVAVPTNTEDRGTAIAQEIGLPSIAVDLKIDTLASAVAIDAQLNELEKIARDKGRAIALAEAYPVTVAKLAAWAQTLAFKELALAPVSAVVTVPAPPAAAKGAPKQ
jgi:polysaccharide deacetylase 2 family uncharacterized protein YibQ